MLDEMLKNLQLYFPTVASRMIEYQDSGDFELVVRCDNSETFIYDDLDKTIRMLPSDSESMTEDMWRREFGRRLRKRMIRKGMTQSELAEKVGISQVMLSNYITGRSMPGFYIVDKLVRALDCSTDDLRYN